MKLSHIMIPGQLLLLVLVALSAPWSLLTHSLLAALLVAVVWQLAVELRQGRAAGRRHPDSPGFIPDPTAEKCFRDQSAKVTERSISQEHSVQERMQAILGTVKEGIVTLDQHGDIVSANPAAMQLFEATPADLIGSCLWQWMVLDEVQTKLLCGNSPVSLSAEQLVEGIKSSGERFPLSLYMDALELDGVEKSVVTLIDVSDLLGARDKLALNQAVKSSILNSALDAIVTIDDEGRIVEFNPAAERTFGYARSTVLGEEMAGLIIPPSMRDHHRAGMQHYLKTGEHKVLGRRIEVTGLHRDGHEFPIELAIAPIHVDQRTLFTAYVRDISERRLFEAELEKAKDKAEAASRAKGDFLAVMSHELRTPLNAIIGSVSLLSDSELTDGQQALLRNAAQAGRAMLWLVHDILDFSKIEVGRLELEVSPFDLRELIHEVLFVLMGRAKDKSIELALTIDPQLPLRLVGDAGRIRQVLINLVGNAIKFTEQGGVHIGLERDQSSNIRFLVEDTGIGISEAVQEKLFEEFVQGDSAYSRKYGGTGLGLAISKRLTSLMGGEVGLASQLGKGSQFWVSLPLQAAGDGVQGCPAGLPEHVWVTDPNPVTRKAISKQLQYWGVMVSEREFMEGGAFLSWKNSSGAWKEVSIGGEGETSLPKPVLPEQLAQVLLGQSVGVERLTSRTEKKTKIKKNARILIAEDSPANQLVAEMMLQRAGYEVECVSNGLEAVQAVTVGKFDLVLMDLSMPEMDGITATQTIRRHGMRLPILAMTANVLKEDLDRCLEAGMDGYVTKPVVQADLLSALVQCLEAQPPIKGIEEADAIAAAAPLWDMHILAKLQVSIGSAVPRMLDLYVSEAELRVANIEKAIVKEDFQVLRHESHVLKSSSGTLGAVGMQHLAEQLERSCIEGDIPTALTLARKIEPLLKQMLQQRPQLTVSQ